MILDGHIHINSGEVNRDGLLENMKLAGMDGGVLLSMMPPSFENGKKGYSAAERMDNLLSWTGSHKGLFPFFWIDPMEEDAVEQVKIGVERGVSGFKVICNRFYPGDTKAMEVYEAIAQAGKPMLFHSGILWDGQSSSRYNRPAEFEALLDVKGLKFALAHVSWPWCDECIAVYGKFLNAYTSRPDLSVEMFIDLTPGTPPVYRDQVLTLLFSVGYDVENNILFGTDCIANNYNHKWSTEWMLRDNGIYRKLGLAQETVNKIYGENLRRFLGLENKQVQKKSVKQAE